MNKAARTRAMAFKHLGILGALVLAVVLMADGGYRSARAEQLAGPQYFATKINVTDLQRSIDFYTKMMGLKFIGQVEGGGVIEAMFTPTGGPTEQMLTLVYRKDRKEPVVHGNAFNNILFVFPDVKERVKLLEAAGHKVTGSLEPHPSTVSWAKEITILFTKDPDDFTIELVQIRQ